MQFRHIARSRASKTGLAHLNRMFGRLKTTPLSRFHRANHFLSNSGMGVNSRVERWRCRIESAICRARNKTNLGEIVVAKEARMSTNQSHNISRIKGHL